MSRSLRSTIGAASRLIAWLRAPIDARIAGVPIRHPEAPSDKPRSGEPTTAPVEPPRLEPAPPSAEVQFEAALRHRAAASLRFLARASAELSETLDYDLTLSR